MNPKTISIIGGRGKMGSLFADAFRKKGYDLLVSDKNQGSNIELAKEGDVVIVTVPIRATEEVLKDIAPYVRKEALLTDFTSVKEKPVELMRELSEGEVIGGHPLFGPSEELRGQNFVLCPVRGDLYLNWYRGLLESLGLKVAIMPPEEHDQLMAVVQCLTHISNLSFAYTLRCMNQNLGAIRDFSTPSCLSRLSAVEKMLSEDPALYADIQSENDFSEGVRKNYLDVVTRLLDGKGIEQIFKETKKYFEGRND